MWNDLPRPIVFAHRGASARAPENTLAAFTLAAREGAPAIELDAKLSADGHVVVFHDQTLDRTSDGRGPLSAQPLSTLRALDAGAWFGPQFRGERIPTLDEVFEAVGRLVFINVELTNYATPDDALVERVVDVVRRHALQRRVLFSSFDPANLRRAAVLLPEVPRGLLAAPLWRGWTARRRTWREETFQALHPFVIDTTAGLVERAHAADRRVHVWTVNRPSQMRRLRALDVDGIFTDDPLLALNIFGGAA